MALEFGVLGPLAVWSDGKAVEVSGAKRRGLLAYLLAHAGEPQPLERIADALWAGSASQRGASTVQTYVSQLRKVFAPEGVQLVHRAGGYVLDFDARALDASRFEAAVAAASAVADRDRRLGLLDDALTLWRGAPLDEFAGQPWADERARQWTRMHVLAHQLRAAALIDLGRHRDALPALEQLVATYQLHEPFWAQLIVARYRCGQQSDALAAVSEVRKLLATELGIEPGAEIADLERKILEHDSSLDAASERRLAVSERPLRSVVEPLPTGVVTFMLTDIEGSTQLWDEHPRAMAAALVQHEALIDKVVSEHGGQLLKSRGEGDATLSVFAAATDAVAAAIDLQQRFHDRSWTNGLHIKTRIALHSGEAETRHGDYYGGTLNRAARIRGIAIGGDLLASRATHELVADQLGDDVVVTELGTHELRGLRRSETVFSIRHRSLPETGPSQRAAEAGGRPQPTRRPRVVAPPGRTRELARLTAICDDVLRGGYGRVVLVEGEPGIGVSTLLAAVGTSIRAMPDAPEVVAFAANTDTTYSLRQWVFDDHAIARMSEVAEHDRMISAVAERASRRGLVLIIDDAAELDQWSLRLIAAMAHSAPARTVVVVGAPTLTHVSDEVGMHLARIAGAGAGTELHLGRFDEGALAEIVAQVWPDADASAQRRWAAHLKSWCDGHPMLVRHALSAANPTDDPAEATVPTSVEVLVRRQVDALTADCVRHLVVAAELGIAIDLALVANVCGAEVDEVAASLAPAIVSGLVRRSVRPGFWEFDHGLVRDVVRRYVDPGDALRWHAAAGEMLRNVGGRDAEAARHLAAAVPLVSAEEARAAAIDAGALLLGSGAYREAAERFREAADLGSDPSSRANALIGLARALESVGERQQADDAYGEATRLAIVVNSPELLAQAAVGGSAHASTVRGRSGRRWRLQQAWSRLPPDAPRRSEVVAELALELLNGGHAWPQALEREVRAIAETEGSRARVLASRVVVAETEATRAATTAEAAALVELALLDDVPEHWAAASLAVGIGVALATGDWDEAALWIDELAGFGARTGEPRARWQSLVYRAVLAEGRGDTRGADEAADEALAVGQRLEMLDAPATFGLHHLGRAYRQGSLAHHAQALARVEQRYRIPVWDALRAAAALDLGDERAAESHLDSATHQLRVTEGRLDHYRVGAQAVACRVAARLGRVDVADELAAQLYVRRGRFVVLGYGGPCLGPVDWHLAAACAASGSTHEADELLADAQVLCRRASASAWLDVLADADGLRY